MSLVKPSLVSVIKQQYIYKLRAYVDIFITLIILQIIALLFSLNGAGSSGGGSAEIHTSVNYYNADIVIYFTLLWGFISMILITTKSYRNDDFLYVSNRMSSHLSNGLFILTASIIAGVTAMLTGFLLKAVMSFFVEMNYLGGASIFAPIELLLGMIAASLYVFLFGVLGYFVGMLVQLNKVFIIVIPAIFFGDLIISFFIMGRESIIMTLLGSVFSETSFVLFILKVIVAVGLLFGSSIALSNRMEVR